MRRQALIEAMRGNAPCLPAVHAPYEHAIGRLEVRQADGVSGAEDDLGVGRRVGKGSTERPLIQRKPGWKHAPDAYARSLAAASLVLPA